MVTIDCVDPHRLAQFWTQTLGVDVAADYGDFVMLQPARHGAPALGLQRVPDPTPGKNRVHVDLRADDREAQVARLEGLGATRVDDQEVAGFAWTVLADPEGNRFCVAGQ